MVSGDSCNDPGTPPGAEQIATSYQEGAKVEFNCTRPGFNTSNDDEWKCVAGAVTTAWSQTGALPTCVGEYK